MVTSGCYHGDAQAACRPDCLSRRDNTSQQGMGRLEAPAAVFALREQRRARALAGAPFVRLNVRPNSEILLEIAILKGFTGICYD